MTDYPHSPLRPRKQNEHSRTTRGVGGMARSREGSSGIYYGGRPHIWRGCDRSEASRTGVCNRSNVLPNRSLTTRRKESDDSQIKRPLCRMPESILPPHPTGRVLEFRCGKGCREIAGWNVAAPALPLAPRVHSNLLSRGGLFDAGQGRLQNQVMTEQPATEEAK